MAIRIEPIPGQPNTFRAVVDELTGGWTTRTAPHLVPDNYLYKAENVVYYRDGILSKRPGNQFYGLNGGGTGSTGSGQPIQSMFRFYPPQQSPSLLVQSNTKIYKGSDNTGTFTVALTGIGPSANCTYAQMHDPDATLGNGTVTFVCDGVNIPKVYNGASFTSVHTGTYVGPPAGSWLPVDPNLNPITPAYCCDWGQHMVYGGQPNDPTALYISDALRPEAFNGFAFTDSGATPYFAYYPDMRDGSLGVITGLVGIGPYLVIFYTTGIVIGINTGQYGATQFQFVRISTRVGCTAPRSIIPMGNYIAFFGGDAFYATDGQSIWKLPDELPTVYANTNKSTRPPLITNPATLFGVRHGDELLWSFDTTGNGQNNQIVMFDQSAQGGWTPGQLHGGGWALWPSGMPMGAAVDCRGPGDTQQLFWGASNADIVGQHDVVTSTAGISGNYADFGNPIRMEVLSKALYFNNPPGPKTVQGMYLQVYLEPLALTYTLFPRPYINTDTAQIFASVQTGNITPIQFILPPSGVTYGTALYGTFLYQAGGIQYQQTGKVFFNNVQSQSIQAGVTETSVFPFGVIGFIIEATVDEPTP